MDGTLAILDELTENVDGGAGPAGHEITCTGNGIRQNRPGDITPGHCFDDAFGYKWKCADYQLVE